MKPKILVSAILCLGVFFYSTNLYAIPVVACEGSIHPVNVMTALQYKIIPAPNNTWGYDILRDNKIFIHQPNRPGLPGREGFTAKEDAVKVARLVIAKIKLGEMPPTVSPEELKALNLTK